VALKLARRGKPYDSIRAYDAYIDMRIVMLEEEAKKLPQDSRGEVDRQWYKRICAELYWVKKGSHNCYMEEEE
jgi:hypothetical protein